MEDFIKQLKLHIKTNNEHGDATKCIAERYDAFTKEELAYIALSAITAAEQQFRDLDTNIQSLYNQDMIKYYGRLCEKLVAFTSIERPHESTPPVIASEPTVQSTQISPDEVGVYILQNKKQTENRTWFTASFIDNDYNTHLRLFSIKTDEMPNDDVLLAHCNEVCYKLLRGRYSVPLNQISPHLSELIFMQLYKMTDLINITQGHNWFRGLDIKELKQELRTRGFGGIGDKIEYYNYTYDKNLKGKVHMKFHCELPLYSIIDWGEDDPLSLLGISRDFDRRLEPCPTPEIREHTNSVKYMEQKAREEQNIKDREAAKLQALNITKDNDGVYLQNVPRCPTCGATSIEKLGMVGKLISVELFGLASNKIGKQFKCKKCGYMW